MDDEKHKLHTGVGNKQILKNLELLATTDVDINIRIPLIKGVNDDLENIKQTAEFINTLEKPPIMVNILPYHNIAQKKYEKLGRLEKFVKMEEPEQQIQQKIIKQFEFYGIKAIIGG